jgi:hypothetical protein
MVTFQAHATHVLPGLLSRGDINQNMRLQLSGSNVASNKTNNW